MALIKLNINSFKRDLGGIANRLIDDAVNRIENKLENAVEDALTKGLNKIGLSNGVAREISSRFTDSFSAGRADEFFRNPTAEQNRVSRRQIEERLLAGVAETTFDSVQRLNTANLNTVESPLLQFPDSLGKYYMRLDFQSYHRPSPQMEAIFRRFKTISLPIPRDLKEQFEIMVDGKEQGVGGGMQDIGYDLLRGAGEGVTKNLFALVYSSVVQAVEGTGAGSAIGQLTRAVPNPHLQAIFSGVQLRTHTFQWTFAPRNPGESRMLMKIIREIKKNSLPAYSTQGTAALQYPSMVDVKLMFKKNGSPRELDMIRFKKCLIQNVNVNYAPAGLPSFFRDTRDPTMIQLEIQFLETEIQTFEDYREDGDVERTDGLQDLQEALDRGGEALGQALGFNHQERRDAVVGAINTSLNSLSNAARESQIVAPGTSRSGGN